MRLLLVKASQLPDHQVAGRGVQINPIYSGKLDPGPANEDIDSLLPPAAPHYQYDILFAIFAALVFSAVAVRFRRR